MAYTKLHLSQSDVQQLFKRGPGTEPTQYASCESIYYPVDDDEHWLYGVRERVARTLRNIIRF